MMRAAVLAIVVCVFAGCASTPAVVIQRDGIRTVSLITEPPLEKYPFEEWNRTHEAFLSISSGRVDAWAQHKAFDARKRAEWGEFLGSWQSGDTMYRIHGSHGPELFDYFVIVRHGKELKRYYVYGGDGMAAVE